MVDPIRRQLLFDFERFDRSGQFNRESGCSEPAPLRKSASLNPTASRNGSLPRCRPKRPAKSSAPSRSTRRFSTIDPRVRGGLHQPGHHLTSTCASIGRAEELYRRATEADPGYVLAYFDLGNVLDELERLDESIAAYLKAVTLSPRYADAHYNLALAYERTGEHRPALRHWRAYVKLDNRGPWADHARGQIRKLLSRESSPSPPAPTTSSRPAREPRPCRSSGRALDPSKEEVCAQEKMGGYI